MAPCARERVRTAAMRPDSQRLPPPAGQPLGMANQLPSAPDWLPLASQLPVAPDWLPLAGGQPLRSQRRQPPRQPKCPPASPSSSLFPPLSAPRHTLRPARRRTRAAALAASPPARSLPAAATPTHSPLLRVRAGRARCAHPAAGQAAAARPPRQTPLAPCSSACRCPSPGPSERAPPSGRASRRCSSAWLRARRAESPRACAPPRATPARSARQTGVALKIAPGSGWRRYVRRPWTVRTAPGAWPVAWLCRSTPQRACRAGAARRGPARRGGRRPLAHPRPARPPHARSYARRGARCTSRMPRPPLGLPAVAWVQIARPGSTAARRPRWARACCRRPPPPCRNRGARRQHAARLRAVRR
mmetsp:Transcript_8934/g.20912  ORF Transcript_8934/g.20912 Transcript_8934/m.20912 type:complete len:360 (+) Transcript_8934:225-1304(+)